MAASIPITTVGTPTVTTYTSTGGTIGGVPTMLKGDYVLLLFGVHSASVPVMSPPGELVQIGTTVVVGNFRVALFGGFVGGTNALSTNVCTASAGTGAVIALHVFRGVDMTTPLDGVTVVQGSFAAATSFTIPGVTTASPDSVAAMMIAGSDDNAGGGSAFTGLTGNGWNLQANVGTANGTDESGAIATQTKAVAGPTGDATVTQAAALAAAVYFVVSLRSGGPTLRDFRSVSAINSGNFGTVRVILCGTPPGVQTGDLLLVFAVMPQDPDVTTGWTKLVETLNSPEAGSRRTVWWKFAESTTPFMPTWTFTPGAANPNIVFAAAFKDIDTTDPFGTLGSNSGGSGTTFTSTGIATDRRKCTVVHWIFHYLGTLAWGSTIDTGINKVLLTRGLSYWTTTSPDDCGSDMALEARVATGTSNNIDLTLNASATVGFWAEQIQINPLPDFDQVVSTVVGDAAVDTTISQFAPIGLSYIGSTVQLSADVSTELKRNIPQYVPQQRMVWILGRDGVRRGGVN